MKQKETTRELLINALIDLASDEFVDSQDLIALAKKSEYELIKELINVAEYFRDRD